MRILAVLLLALLVLASPGAAQATRTVAIVDFADETGDGINIGAVYFSADLAQALASAGGGRLRVLAVEGVRQALRARRYAPADLVSPTKAQEIAQAVGADWVVTGRWLHLDLDLPDDGARVPPLASALLEIRVLDAASRQVLLNDTFSGLMAGLSFPGTIGNYFLLRQAARQAIVRAAREIARL